MASNVTPIRGAPLPLPEPSPALRKLLDRHEVQAGYGGDDGMTGGGDFRRGPWIRPEWVDRREGEEARAALPIAQAWAGPAPESLVKPFLTTLWAVTKRTADLDFDTMLRAYPMALRKYPAWCWRPDRAEEAALSFKWFPSAAELAAFHDHAQADIAARLEKLEHLAQAPSRPPADAHGGAADRGFRWSREAAEEHGRKLAARREEERRAIAECIAEQDRLAAEAAGKAAAIPPGRPAREPGESDSGFVARLVDFAKARCDMGERALRAAARRPPRDPLVHRAMEAREDRARPPDPAPAEGEA